MSVQKILLIIDWELGYFADRARGVRSHVLICGADSQARKPMPQKVTRPTAKGITKNRCSDLWRLFSSFSAASWDCCFMPLSSLVSRSFILDSCLEISAKADKIWGLRSTLSDGREVSDGLFIYFCCWVNLDQSGGAIDH
jgi:hypothetical protein